MFFTGVDDSSSFFGGLDDDAVDVSDDIVFAQSTCIRAVAFVKVANSYPVGMFHKRETRVLFFCDMHSNRTHYRRVP